ncbi:MAG: hypothetical protein ACE367_18655 [Acidimicrobiales bacterium]
MPFSATEGREQTVRWLDELRPATVVDIGAGAGAGADLCSMLVHPPAVDAIEIWAPYIERYQLERRYRCIVVGDACSLPPDAYRDYDVAILGDVIEHMAPDLASSLLRSLTEAGVGHAVVTVPLGHHPQGPVGGNPYERHVTDDWTHSDVMTLLRPFGVRRFWLGNVVGRYLVRLADPRPSADHLPTSAP